jgi:FkbM family methyltransferase
MTITPAPIDPPEVHAELWKGFSGRVGWDVGSNVGQSLGEMAERFSKVHTFEPAIECLPLLRENADMLNNSDVPSQIVVHPVALSDFDGIIELVDIPDKIDTGQLVSLEADGMEYDAKQQSAKMRQIEAYKADTMLFEQLGSSEMPDFMKIDVEGHELKVLKGAKDILGSWTPDLLVEIHSTELGNLVTKYLEGFGYQCEVVRHPHYTAYRGLQHMYDVHYWLRCFAF